jgi:hypothetical protein
MQTGPTNNQRGLRQLVILLALIATLTAAAFLVLSPSAHAATPAKPKAAVTYIVFDETNVSPKERGEFNVFCRPGDQVKSYQVITKVKKYEAARFQFTNGVVQGGVWVAFTGTKREETLSVRATCKVG